MEGFYIHSYRYIVSFISHEYTLLNIREKKRREEGGGTHPSQKVLQGNAPNGRHIAARNRPVIIPPPGTVGSSVRVVREIWRFVSSVLGFPSDGGEST